MSLAPIKLKLQKDFYLFFKMFWDKVSPDEYISSKHIKYICSELQELGEAIIEHKQIPYDYLVINVPPGSSKSTIASIIFPTWLLANDSSIFTINTSYSNDLATGFIRKSKLIFNSPEYIEIFGELELTKDNEGHIETVKSGGRYATSTGGTITGVHANCIIIDDPLSVEQSYSKTFIDKANRYIFQTLTTRKRDKSNTPVILIMQRLNEDDPSGHILSKDFNTKHICLPAEISEIATNKELYTDGLLDPVRLSKKVLNDLIISLGSYSYAGQIDQRPAPLEGGIIKREWFDYFTDEIDINEFDLCIDTAYTKNTQNDPTAIIKYQIKDNILYIIEVFQLWLEFPELEKKIIELANRNTKIYIEPKASGLSIVQQLKQNTMLNIISDTNPTVDKITRLNAVTPIIESKRIKLLKSAWNDNYLTELCTFPNAKHDDLVDVTVMALNKMNKKKRGIRRG